MCWALPANGLAFLSGKQGGFTYENFQTNSQLIFSFLSLCRDAFTAAAVNGIRSHHNHTEHQGTSHVSQNTEYFCNPCEFTKGKVCYVKNIKTGSKNLIAKNTYYYTSTSSDEYAAPYASIGLYAKKKGKYVVSYDICDKAGKKLSSGKTTVYVSDDQPIKSVKFDKKYLSSAITFKKSGKLSISMNKGYKLKKITVTTYNKSGKEVVKTVRNNSTIKLGEYAQIYDNSYSDGSRYFSTSLAARTQIKITYTDKYTKQKCESSYTINRLAK